MLHVSAPPHFIFHYFLYSKCYGKRTAKDIIDLSCLFVAKRFLPSLPNSHLGPDNPGGQTHSNEAGPSYKEKSDSVSDSDTSNRMGFSWIISSPSNIF